MADTFQEIDRRRESAEGRRLNELKRFHIGDVAYPLYQYSFPLVWGIVTDVDVTIHKICVNLNGVIRQYDPDDLILINPEQRFMDKMASMKQIQANVSRAFERR